MTSCIDRNIISAEKDDAAKLNMKQHCTLTLTMIKTEHLLGYIDKSVSSKLKEVITPLSLVRLHLKYLA